jgi:hypothetical protein
MRPISAVAAQSLYSSTFGSVLPTTATTAESAVNAKIAAEAPLIFHERIQVGVDLSGDVALEAADDLTHPDEGDDAEGAVGGAPRQAFR